MLQLFYTDVRINIIIYSQTKTLYWKTFKYGRWEANKIELMLREKCLLLGVIQRRTELKNANNRKQRERKNIVN